MKIIIEIDDMKAFEKLLELFDIDIMQKSKKR